MGIDLAPGMVRRTGADLADLGWVEVLLGDATAPSLPPGSFDVVASSLVLFFLADPGAALGRWRELLVPDGRLGVTTFGDQDPRWHEIDAVFEPYLPPHLKDARTSGTTGPFDSDAGMESLAADAALVEVRTVRRTVGATFRDVDHLLEFTWSHGQRAMWEAVPTEARDGVPRPDRRPGRRARAGSERLRLQPGRTPHAGTAAGLKRLVRVGRGRRLDSSTARTKSK